MFERLKIWWLAVFLKKYIAPDQCKPRRYPEAPPDVDLPRFIDRYAERNSDLTTQDIELKVREAVSRLKSEGRF